ELFTPAKRLLRNLAIQATKKAAIDHQKSITRKCNRSFKQAVFVRTAIIYSSKYSPGNKKNPTSW
ncbi:hypothetical protein P5Z58_11285, partial [Limosilactobacillus mucosae]|nr:hypothetical protein [Limosilactobacillus mucosae]